MKSWHKSHCTVSCFVKVLCLYSDCLKQMIRYFFGDLNRILMTFMNAASPNSQTFSVACWMVEKNSTACDVLLCHCSISFGRLTLSTSYMQQDSGECVFGDIVPAKAFSSQGLCSFWSPLNERRRFPVKGRYFP